MDDDHRVDDGEDIKVPIAAIQKVDPQVMNSASPPPSPPPAAAVRG